MTHLLSLILLFYPFYYLYSFLHFSFLLNYYLYFFIISTNGNVHAYIFYEDNVDKKLIDFGNYFKTKEEAERKRFEIKLHRQLELFALKNNETEIDWNDDSNEKHTISYNRDGGIFIDEVYSLKDFGQVYFTSKEVAEKAIETFKDDLIRYFTSNK